MKRSSKILRDLDADIFDERALHASACKLLSRGATLGTPVRVRHGIGQSEISIDGGKSFTGIFGLAPLYDMSGDKGNMAIVVLSDGVWIGSTDITVQNGSATRYGSGILISSDGSITRYVGGSEKERA